ncbi:hypothetical protein, partial [Thermoactinomyces daqus]
TLPAASGRDFGKNIWIFIISHERMTKMISCDWQIIVGIKEKATGKIIATAPVVLNLMSYLDELGAKKRALFEVEKRKGSLKSGYQYVAIKAQVLYR